MKKLFLFMFCFCGIVAASLAEKWNAHWISGDFTATPNQWSVFKKNIDIEKLPSELKARIAVDSKYWLWINGRMAVYEGGLKRGPVPDGTYYDVVDIAPYLKKGKNTISLLLWHFGKDGFSHKDSGCAAILFEAESPEISICSDGTWKTARHPAYADTRAPYPNFRLPESNILFDATKDMPGWNSCRNDEGMVPATEIDGKAWKVMGCLVERPIPQWKDYGLKSYEKVRKSENGDTLFCRLPYNCHVSPYIRVDAGVEDTIRIHTDNYKGGGGYNLRVEYITRRGRQEYENLNWMNGNEVWYIIPEGVRVLEVKYRETGYDTEFSGSFRCDDPFYNELWKRSARTLYITMRDTYMDCPDRERAQWWGDEVNELGEAFYALSPSSRKLAVKGIHELMGWQREDGTIYAPVPAGNWNKELPLQMLASVGWYGFYTQYFYSADSSFIAAIYDRLHKYLHEVWETDGKGMARFRKGEWSWGDWGQNIDMEVLTNCWYYLALKAEKKFSAMLGKTSDEQKIEGMMESLAANFDDCFWTGESYRSEAYGGKTDDRSQAMAVLSGLASKEKYGKLIEVLKNEYHASPYMEKYVLEALFEMGAPDDALERMKKRYAGMLEYKDFTTLFEGWGVGKKGFGGGTINHAWSGGPLTLLSQKVCGIEPTSPGFRTFAVSPQMAFLNFAEAEVDTQYGMISVKLQRVSDGHARLKIIVPEQTSAEVLEENGKKLRLEPGKHILLISVD